MNTSEFFENYLEMTHENWAKDSLASVRTILKDYITDVKMHQRQQNPKTSRAKTVYKNAELQKLIHGSRSRSPQSTIHNYYTSTIEQLNIVHNRALSRRTEARQ
ncbi:unnamed protein product [Mucor fragilis]